MRPHHFSLIPLSIDRKLEIATNLYLVSLSHAFKNPMTAKFPINLLFLLC